MEQRDLLCVRDQDFYRVMGHEEIDVPYRPMRYICCVPSDMFSSDNGLYVRIHV